MASIGLVQGSVAVLHGFSHTGCYKHEERSKASGSQGFRVSGFQGFGFWVSISLWPRAWLAWGSVFPGLGSRFRASGFRPLGFAILVLGSGVDGPAASLREAS